MSESIQGGCRCKNIRYEISFHPIWAAVCYCTDCQECTESESSGTILGVPKFAFKFLSGSIKAIETVADSGNRVQRGYCESCGSCLLLYPLAYPDMMTVRAGTLDYPDQFSPQFAIFTQSAKPGTAFPKGIPIFKKMPKSPEELQAAMDLINQKQK